jgi:hypothetical protein
MNENNPPRKKHWEWLKPSRSEPHLVEETGRRATSRDVWFCVSTIMHCSNDYSRPFSRLRGMDLVDDPWGQFANSLPSTSLEALDSLPTLDPRLQVPAHRTSSLFS